MLLKHCRDLFDHLVDAGFSLRLLGFQHLCHLMVVIRVKIEETEVLHLVLDVAKAQSVSDRAVYVESLGRLLDLLLLAGVLKGPHVVKTVYQLDDDYSDVLGHRNEDLAVVGSLVLFPVLEFQLTDLGYAFDQIGNVFIKLVDDLLLADAAVLHGVMEQAGRNGLGTGMQRGQDVADVLQMNEVRFTALTLLILVAFPGKFIRPVDHGQRVRLVNVGPDLFEE